MLVTLCLCVVYVMIRMMLSWIFIVLGVYFEDMESWLIKWLIILKEQHFYSLSNQPYIRHLH